MHPNQVRGTRLRQMPVFIYMSEEFDGEASGPREAPDACAAPRTPVRPLRALVAPGAPRKAPRPSPTDSDGVEEFSLPPAASIKRARRELDASGGEPENLVPTDFFTSSRDAPTAGYQTPPCSQGTQATEKTTVLTPLSEVEAADEAGTGGDAAFLLYPRVGTKVNVRGASGKLEVPCIVVPWPENCLRKPHCFTCITVGAWNFVHPEVPAVDARERGVTWELREEHETTGMDAVNFALYEARAELENCKYYFSLSPGLRVKQRRASDSARIYVNMLFQCSPQQDELVEVALNASAHGIVSQHARSASAELKEAMAVAKKVAVSKMRSGEGA